VPDPHRTYELRCPVHGFIPFNDWEREIINQPAFQRLRRIRQLAWTDQVYPGAMHTRFEHSFGVMHIATQLFDAIVRRSMPVLESELAFNKTSLDRNKVIVRLTALLHDTGHSPFSHAGEDVFPVDPKTQQHFNHESYSAAIIRHELRDVIENHPANTREFNIKAEEVAALLDKSATDRQRLFWRPLIDGQMDADRMDYLLRDSLHAGVDYGRYDWRRLLNTIQAIKLPAENEFAESGVRIGITEGGIHAAEALVLARYYMFTQVYFHKTRVAYDHHIRQALKAMLPDSCFPPPEENRLKEYLAWDDWRVLGRLADGAGGEHGQRLAKRNHFREVFHTAESPKKRDTDNLAKMRTALGTMLVAEESSTTNAYKLATSDVIVVTEDKLHHVRPLSNYSPVVKNLNKFPIKIVRLYTRSEDATAARAIVASKTRKK